MSEKVKENGHELSAPAFTIKQMTNSMAPMQGTIRDPTAENLNLRGLMKRVPRACRGRAGRSDVRGA